MPKRKFYVRAIRREYYKAIVEADSITDAIPALTNRIREGTATPYEVVISDIDVTRIRDEDG